MAPFGQTDGIRLVSNRGGSYIGSYVLGKGFLLGPDQAQELIQRDPRNQEVLFPYLNGEDLNTRPDCSASRWVINFHDWSEDRARSYPDVFAIVERDVKPERAKNNRPARRDRWWQYAERAPRLYEAIAELDRVLVVTLVSRTVMPMFVPTDQVFSHGLGIFAAGGHAHAALLSSSIHYAWAIMRGSSLKGDLRYTPSDVYETLPRPTPTARMEEVGSTLGITRRTIMIDRQVGLTKLYNMVHDRSVMDHDIQILRDAHVSINESVAEAYGWTDLALSHGFHETRQGLRFTVAHAMQTEILDRLLELNHAQYAADAPGRLPTSNVQSATRRPVDRESAENFLF